MVEEKLRRVSIIVGNRDRPTELFGLMQSLRTQTFQEWDLVVIDDASGTPINNYYFVMSIVQRLNIEGHAVRLVRNNISMGVSKMRNQSVEFALKEFPKNNYLLRIDDDTLCEPDYIEKLFRVIDAGYDLASGLTPPLAGVENTRDVKFVKPIINRVVLDETGGFLVNGDDCGHTYSEEVIIPAHHFRSSALYRIEIHTVHNVWYEDNLSKSGMREEEFFSFRIILAGLKLGVHTGAIHYHLMTPSGGQRTASNEMHLQNQRILNRWVKKQFKERGNFIDDYDCKFGAYKDRQFSNLKKSTNFLMTKEE